LTRECYAIYSFSLRKWRLFQADWYLPGTGNFKAKRQASRANLRSLSHSKEWAEGVPLKILLDRIGKWAKVVLILQRENF
jgi:hypothetical protein